LAWVGSFYSLSNGGSKLIIALFVDRLP